MNILINASNLKKGGGLQVADSIVSQLCRFPQHRFIVVLSSYLDKTAMSIANYNNTVVHRHDIKNSLATLLWGRDKVLDGLVDEYRPEAVLTVFGPARWTPRCKHLSGFAMSQLTSPQSPYFTRMRWRERMWWKMHNGVYRYFFKRSANWFWTENPTVTEQFGRLMGEGKRVYTVTNYYNQVFDEPERWTRNVRLPDFDGVTLLSISTHYPHKNYELLVDAAAILEREHPDLRFRFVLTFGEEEMPVPEGLRSHFVFVGRVDIEECPHLYEQSDVMVMPTLLESFTATYPEAMRMGLPIVTTDLDFARGLCGDAACYYSATDAHACAEAIYRVATDKALAERLVRTGREQLKHYDDYNQRTEKLIGILERITNNKTL